MITEIGGAWKEPIARARTVAVSPWQAGNDPSFPAPPMRASSMRTAVTWCCHLFAATASTRTGHCASFVEAPAFPAKSPLSPSLASGIEARMGEDAHGGASAQAESPARKGDAQSAACPKSYPSAAIARCRLSTMLAKQGRIGQPRQRRAADAYGARDAEDLPPDIGGNRF